ncbi:MAG: EAL domain-containing protein [Methyloprofundus sp.]|nr:EAL domain-containing protein [Methyloprofundus sp.]
MKRKPPIDSAKIDLAENLDIEEKFKQKALTALRNGDFDFALKAIQGGDSNIEAMVEDLKIYQAELEVQNEELRHSQLLTEQAMRRFSNLFDSLPVAALMIDEMGVVRESNEIAGTFFQLNRQHLQAQFFPRMLKKPEHGRFRRLIEQTKDSGQGVMFNVGFESHNAPVFIGDIYASLLPNTPEHEPRFILTIVDQTESVAQRRALEASRKHFMAYFDSAPMGMAATSPEKGWIEVNDKLCSMLGYSESELRCLTWLELTHPDDVTADVSEFNQILRGEIDSYKLDKRFICKDGSILDAHMAVCCVRRHDASVDYCVAIVEDIRERKRAQKAIEQRDIALKHQAFILNERVKELQTIYAISKLTQQPTDLDSFVQQVIALIPAGMQFANDVVVQLSLSEHTYPEALINKMLASLTSDITVNGEVCGRLEVGYSRAHDALDIGPFFQQEQALIDGVAELIGRFKERIRNEAEHAMTAKRHAGLLALTTHAPTLNDDALLDFAIGQAQTLTNSQVSSVYLIDDAQRRIQLCGCSANPLENSQQADLSLCDTQQHNLNEAGLWSASVNGKCTIINNTQAEDANLNYSVCDANLTRYITVPVMIDDKVVMLFCVANKVRDYDAGDVALVEMLANNTWALLQGNRSHRKLAIDASVFRMSREAVMVTDTNLKIISVNHAFSEISGYSPEEALGQTAGLLKSRKHPLEFYTEMWQHITNNGHWQGEIWNRRKNGEIYPQWLGISAVRDGTGNVTEYIAIFMDITEQVQSREKIHHLAHHDPLTDLPNRTLLRDRCEQAMAFADRAQGMMALLYMDLDHFKNINDSLGHPLGDKLLIQTGIRLRQCVRNTDTVSRVGGDEFIVLLNNIHSYDSVAEISEKMLSAIAQPFEIDDKSLNIGGSIGICVYPEDGADFDQLLKHADISLYQAKSMGRNCYKFYTDEINQRVIRRLTLESELRKAISLKQIYLDYQPQFDLKSGRIIGAEALMRWHHPELGLVTPVEFIPIAEESGLIVELGHYAMQQACHQAKQWVDAGHAIRIAVNVSYAQFVRNNLSQLVLDSLQDSQLAPHHLELEITESILISDTSQVLEEIRQLRDLGILFSIDDFGTGYSSLSYLKRFAVGKLKIDKSFIDDVPGDSDDDAIVAAIVNLAHSLQIECIAEGVETQAQADYLQQLGCDQIQGYLLGKPMTPALFKEKLALHNPLE